MYQNRNTIYTSRRRQTASRNYGRNSNIAGFQYDAKIGPFVGVLLVAGIFSSMGLMYLQSASQPNSYSSEIQEIDEKIAESERVRSDLEVENARLTSLNSIQNSEVAQKMTQPASIKYAE